MTPTSGPLTFWVDVEDFFLYFESNPRPSGIQRLVFEVLCVLPARAKLCPGAPRIAFVRHTGDERLLLEVGFAEVAAAFNGSSRGDVAEKPPAAPLRIGARRSIGRTLRLGAVGRIERLPPAVAGPLLEAGVLQVNVFRHLRQLARPARVVETVATPVAPEPMANAFGGRAGDVLLVLGAPWGRPGFASLLRALRDDHGISAALLLYDLIPLRRPEWCAAVLVETFSGWLSETLPLYSRLMAISHATARDVQAYAGEIGLALASPVQPVPIGTGFSGGDSHAGKPVRGLPAPGSYVLFVSTIEARKNHALLFRVWRRLLAELPRAQVPTLVFAGRVGWLVADLMQQLENADWLDGKIRLLRDPTDAELSALYEGCQFTVFPSLFEGWGLPVSESLQHRRPCVASNCTSVPEAGGHLARYFDPENTDDAVRTIRAVIEDKAGLAAWRARVAQEFRPVRWERTADAILAACLPAVAPVLEHSQ